MHLLKDLGHFCEGVASGTGLVGAAVETCRVSTEY